MRERIRAAADLSLANLGKPPPGYARRVAQLKPPAPGSESDDDDAVPSRATYGSPPGPPSPDDASGPDEDAAPVWFEVARKGGGSDRQRLRAVAPAAPAVDTVTLEDLLGGDGRRAAIGSAFERPCIEAVHLSSLPLPADQVAGEDFRGRHIAAIRHAYKTDPAAADAVKSLHLISGGGGVNSLSCTLLVPELMAIFAGCADGTVASWAQRGASFPDEWLYRPMKGHKGRVHSLLALVDVVPPPQPQGPVTTALLAAQAARASLRLIAQGRPASEALPPPVATPSAEAAPGSIPIVLSGAADGHIRCWDPNLRGKVAVCVQTLTGHAGTVTCLARVGDLVASGGTDGTVRLWKAAPYRGGLLYPWLEPQRVLGRTGGGAWLRGLAYGRTHKVGDMGALYAADGNGGVVVHRPRSTVSPAAAHHLEFAPGSAGACLVAPRAAAVDRRGALAVLVVAEECLVLVTSCDHTFRGYEATTGALEHDVTNPHGCVFAGMAWVSAHRQALLVDHHGFLMAYDLRAAALVYTSRLATAPLLGVATLESSDEVLLTLADRVERWRLDRDAPYRHLAGGGHTGPLVAIAVAASPPIVAGEAAAQAAWMDELHGQSLAARVLANVPAATEVAAAAAAAAEAEATAAAASLAARRVYHAASPETRASLRGGSPDGRPSARRDGWQPTGEITEPAPRAASRGTRLSEGLHSLPSLDVSSPGPRLGTAASGQSLYSLEGDVTTPTEAYHRGALDALLQRGGGGGGGSGPVSGRTTARSVDDAAAGGGSEEPPPPAWRIFTAGLDNTVRLWDPLGMTVFRVLKETEAEVSALLYVSRRGLVITGHDNGRIRLWNSDTGSTVNFWEHGNAVTCLALATTAKGDETVLSGSLDGRVGVWDMRRRRASRPQLLSAFDAHPRAEVLCLVFDPRRALIITGSSDRSIRAFHAASHAPAGRVYAHDDAVTCLGLDGGMLYSGSEDATIKVWDLAAMTHPKRGGSPQATAGGLGGRSPSPSPGAHRGGGSPPPRRGHPPPRPRPAAIPRHPPRRPWSP